MTVAALPLIEPMIVLVTVRLVAVRLVNVPAAAVVPPTTVVSIVPEVAVIEPAKLPVTLPATLPVTLPVTFPVNAPVNVVE